MTIQDALNQLILGRDLTRDQAAAVMRTLMSGEATPAQMGALLAALRVKGETPEEISGFAQTMRALATRVPTMRSPLVDTCGTGGDHSGTFNISTTAAFVVAGAGVAVAKHGNRSATSRCGSADVLEALGVHIEADPARVGRSIDETGIGFLYARTLHGAMRHVAPVRSEMGIRTVFNILGPLTNPARADGQVIGVFDAALVGTLAEVARQLGTRHTFVVHGSDGLDEITLTGPTFVAETCGGGAARYYTIAPEDFGMQCVPSEVLRGGEPAVNAALLRGVLENRPGPHLDIVLLNAAPAIVAGGLAKDLQEGVDLARLSVESGSALAKLEALAEASHDSG